MNKPKRYRILCYLDDDIGRDLEIVIPVIYFAEKLLNCQVEFAFVWDVHAIYRKKPDLVLLSNSMGSPLNFQISRYAHKNNIPVFALISEGNFRTDGTFNYWGYNKDKEFYEDFICLWSDRTYDFLSTELPSYKDKMVITGATGFDRYQIYHFINRKKFLAIKNLEGYKKVVVYAGWSFGKMYNKQGRTEIKYLHKNNPDRIKWMEEQMYIVEEMLKTAIENNPDTLFILKRHPNEANPSIVKESMNEMIRLQDYQNVLYVKQNENIHDLISISDLWMAFESTTVMESWLMKDNPTILLNSDPEFKRDNLYKGSLIARNSNELQSYFNEFYNTGSINEFYTPELLETRNQLIKDTIGFGDGFNHVRAGVYLAKSLALIDPETTKDIRLSFTNLVRYMLLHIGKYFYIEKLFRRLPKFKKTIWIFERFRLKSIPKIKQLYYTYLDEFYKENKILDKWLDGTVQKEILRYQQK